MSRWLDRGQAVDESWYRSVAATSTPSLDEPLRLVSWAADWSRLSIASAGIVAVAGGRRGRRAAAYGLGCVAVASAVANLGAKLATRRGRPDRSRLGVDPDRQVAMPTSTSFPSGHSASAFAFATGVRHVWPAASIPCFVLAATVAYSRVHTGVHYPGDVIAGSLLGMTSAAATCRALDQLSGLAPMARRGVGGTEGTPSSGVESKHGPVRPAAHPRSERGRLEGRARFLCRRGAATVDSLAARTTRRWIPFEVRVTIRVQPHGTDVQE